MDDAREGQGPWRAGGGEQGRCLGSGIGGMPMGFGEGGLRGHGAGYVRLMHYYKLFSTRCCTRGPLSLLPYITALLALLLEPAEAAPPVIMDDPNDDGYGFDEQEGGDSDDE